MKLVTSYVLLISVIDVYEALISLDINKSTDFDDISPKVLQSCAEALCEPLHHFYSLCHYVMLLYHLVKSGDPNSIKNYHPYGKRSVTKF